MAAEFDLCVAFVQAHPDEAARAMERLPTGQAAALIEAMPPEAAARALAVMTPAVAADSLAQLDPRAAAPVLAELRVDRSSLLLRQMEGSRRTAILEQLPPDEARMLAAMLRYPEGTAGALMDPRVLSAPEDSTAAEALSVIRRSPRHRHEYLYVVDRDRLVGVVSLATLMRARPADQVAAVMTSPVSRLSAQAGRAAILGHPGWRQLRELPVVDEASLLIGAISYETFRALEDEARGRDRQLDAVSTVFALGELYWLSLSGMIDGVATVVRRASRANQSGEGAHGSV